MGRYLAIFLLLVGTAEASNIHPTPVPTSTPQVFPTAVPTATVVPTATPVNTPVPTATVVPTATPVNTPVPTATAVPAVPTATPYLAYDTNQDEGTPTTAWRIWNCIGDLIACASDAGNSRTNITITNPTPLPTATPIPPVATATPAPTATPIPAVATPTPNNGATLTGGCTGVVANGSTNYCPVGYSAGAQGASSAQTLSIVAPCAGTARNFYLFTSVAPGAAKTYDYFVYKNNSATALTCQVAGAAATTCSDLTHSFTFSAGDTIGPVSTVPGGTPTQSQPKYGFQISCP